MLIQGKGSWLESLSFGAEKYWSVTEKPSQWKYVSDVDPTHALPSDGHIRRDLQLIAEEKFDEAEVFKNRYED
jgi:hypothetical protein